MKCLVLRFSSLGDVIQLSPALRCLKTQLPETEVELVTSEEYAELFTTNPHLSKVHAFSRKGGWKGLRDLTAVLSAEPYDLIYDAHRSLRTRWMVPRLKAQSTLQFPKPYVRRSLKLFLKLPVYESHLRTQDRHLRVLSQVGIKADGQGPEVFVPPSLQERIDHQFPDASGAIALVPSAQWPGKRWPWIYFRKLSILLFQHTSRKVILLGGPGDRFLNRIGAGLDPRRVVNLQGQLGLMETAALLKRCALGVSNDTGLAHLCDAVGTPAVVFLGPTDGTLGCLPWNPRSRVVEEQLWCRPCSKNGEASCIRRERFCLTRLTPQRVLEQCLAIIG